MAHLGAMKEWHQGPKGFPRESREIWKLSEDHLTIPSEYETPPVKIVQGFLYALWMSTVPPLDAISS